MTDPHDHGRVNWAAVAASLVLATCLVGLVWFTCRATVNRQPTVPVAPPPEPMTEDLAQWVEVPEPVRGTREYERFWEAAAWSKDGWVVGVKAGRVVARPKRDVKNADPLPGFPLDVRGVPAD